MNLNINSIAFRNFLSYGSRWQKVDFISGINLILGIDKGKDRSNGSGKSALLETIPFALYGQINRKIVKDDIVNWKNGKECEVAIEFSRDNDNYSILRAIKPDKLEVYKNGIILDTPSHKRDFQKQIEEEILGIDSKTFMSIIYSNINSSVPILTMSKPNKRKFIESIFGLELYTSLVSKSNESLNNLEKKIYENTLSIQFSDQSINENKRQITLLSDKISKMISSMQILNDAKERYNDYIDKWGKSDETLKSLLEERISIQKNINGVNDIIYKVNNKKTILREKLHYIKEELKKESSIKNKIDDIDRIKDEIKNVQIDNIESNILSCKESISDNRDKVIDLKDNTKRKIEIEIATLTSQIKGNIDTNKIKGKDKCPTCGTLIDSNKIIEDDNDCRRHIQQEIEEKKKILCNIDKSIEEIIDTRKEIEDKLNKYATIKSTYEQSLLKLESLLFYEQEMEKIDILKIKDVKYIKTNSKLDILVNKINKQLSSLNIKMSLLDEEIINIKNIIKEIEKLKTEINILTNKVTYEEKTKEDVKSLIKDCESKISNGIIAKEQNTKKLSGLNLLCDYLRCCKDICKDENIKQYAISSDIPYLNQQTNHYLAESGHNFYVKLDKWLECDIKGPGIKRGTYGNLSGGETRSIDLSLQFAFLDIKRIRAGIWPDILITDELLDSSIDEYGLEKILSIIKTKQEEGNLKVFLVSHRKEVSEIDADRVYIVEKKDGYSNIIYN